MKEKFCMSLDRLRKEVLLELDELSAVASEIDSLLNDTQDRTGTVRECTAAGGFLAQYYGGIENILKRFVKALDGELPSGDEWHIRLVGMFAEGTTSGMPVLFGKPLATTLGQLRRVRHVVRNAYGRELTWDRLVPAMQASTQILPQLRTAFLSALDTLKADDDRAQP
jgi:hypothetical protein